VTTRPARDPLAVEERDRTIQRIADRLDSTVTD
jgi:hypothetical protein